MTDHALKNVGNIIKLRDEIDQKNRITNHIRSHLAVTDIIPTDFYINLKNMNTGFWAISYDPIPAIEDFVRICKNYDLTDYSGVRLWLTDDSVSVDNIQNNYAENVIESAFDSLSGAQNIIGTVRQFGQSLGSPGTNILNSMEQVANAASSSISDLASSVISDVNLRNQVSSAMATLGKTAAGVIFHGKKVSLPKIWKSTSYSPALHLSIKLVSPYGDPKAIKHYIIEPLLYVLILSLPRTNDGVSYGIPRPIWVNGYGSTSLNLGYIESVQIRRGGRETSYNIYKQPLTLDISVTIKPLVDGIAVADGIKDFTTFESCSTEAFEDPATSRPCITTLGNIINSLKPAPKSTVLDESHNINPRGFEQFAQNLGSSTTLTATTVSPTPSQASFSTHNL